MTMSDGINISEAEDVIFKIYDVNENPTDIVLSETSFFEDNDIGHELSIISVIDPDLNDSYSLVIVNDFGDFEKFEIIDNKLKLTQSISFDEHETLSIKIIAEDSGGLTFSKEFIINVLESTLNTSNIGLNSIKTYPNPINDYIIVDNFIPLQLTVYEINGKILNEYFLDEGKNKINTSSLSNGLYLFSFKSESETRIHLVIKE